MQLNFLARADLLVNEPGKLVVTGQAIRRVGRKFVPAKKDAAGKVIAPASYPATKEPFTVDANSPGGQALVKRCRRGELLAADKATSEFCQVDHIDAEFHDGVWVEKSAAKPAAKPSRSKETA